MRRRYDVTKSKKSFFVKIWLFGLCGIISSPDRRTKSKPSDFLFKIRWNRRQLFFFWKILRSGGSFRVFRWCHTFEKWRHSNTYSDIRSKYFFEKKYVSITPWSRAHVGERNKFLSAIRRSYRRSKSAWVIISDKCRLFTEGFRFNTFITSRDFPNKGFPVNAR